MALLRYRMHLSEKSTAAVIVQLRQYDARVRREAKRVTKEYAEATRDLTYFLAPKDTWFMAEHVKILYAYNGLAFEVGWDAADFEEAGHHAFYPWFQEFGTSKMRAQPSLGPAWNDLYPQYIDALGDVMLAAAERREARRRRGRGGAQTTQRQRAPRRTA